MLQRTAVLLLILLMVNCRVTVADINFDWVTVGNPGNLPDDTGFGEVSYTYRISRHEVTVEQYAEFLQKVAQSDPHELFNINMDIIRGGTSGSFSYSFSAAVASKPITWVSFFDAMRFVNWLENGQLSDAGTTEFGVYAVDTGLNEIRASSATFALPSENEWYKAAYYDPTISGYWDYPTGSDTSLIGVAPPGGANSGNKSNAVGTTTLVGAYPASSSHYGTFDQAGNVWEWNEAIVATGFRGRRGGAWNFGPSDAIASFIGQSQPQFGFQTDGFRVVSVPEPSALLCLCIAVVTLGSLSIRSFLIRHRGKQATAVQG